MASGSTGLPAFLRDISGLQIVYIDPSKEVLDIETEGREVKVKVATWSPDGQLLAFVDPNEGVGVATVEEARLEMNILPGSSKSTVGIYWSPLGSTLVTVSLYQKGSSESNLQLWRRTPGEVDFECSSSFVHPKLEAKHQVVKWTADEGLCARLLPEGHLEVHQGSEISGSPALYKFARPAGDFEFAGRSRLAIFVPDLRDDLQRVAAPAEVCVWEVASSDGELTKTEKIKAEVKGAKGQISLGVVPCHRAGPTCHAGPPTWPRTARSACNFTSFDCPNPEVTRSSSVRSNQLQISRSSQRALSQTSLSERQRKKDRLSQADPRRSLSARFSSISNQPAEANRRIPLVVDGCDLVDPDAQDLLDPLSSWEGKKPYVPPAMMVPCPPDRWKHEEHLDKLNVYREEVTNRPQRMAEDVDLKRWDHERLLDNFYLTEG